jgi:hypothetical protein
MSDKTKQLIASHYELIDELKVQFENDQAKGDIDGMQSTRDQIATLLAEIEELSTFETE